MIARSACYTAGTAIAMSSGGEVPVETQRSGDAELIMEDRKRIAHWVRWIPPATNAARLAASIG
jgi:hypothetical protein